MLVINEATTWKTGIVLMFPPPMPQPVLMNFVVFPPGCGDSVTDF